MKPMNRATDHQAARRTAEVLELCADKPVTLKTELIEMISSLAIWGFAFLK